MTEPRRASDELVALAVASRPDWSPHGVRAAIADATTIGWEWPKILTGMARLIIQPDKLPGHLVDDRHTARGEPLPEERVHALAEQARAGLPKGVP